MSGPDDMGGPEWDGHESDRERAARYLGQVADLRAEVSQLRAKLAEARGLRLGRAPTENDVFKHLSEGGWLSRGILGTWGESTAAQMADGIRCGAGSLLIDAIPLDANGQPCPVGGWGG